MTVLRFGSVLQLTRALAFRGFREQGRWILVNPLLLGAFFLFLVAAAFYFPQVLTGPTRHAIETGAMRYQMPNYQGAVALAIILNQAPYFVSLLGALVGSNLAQNMVGQESTRGGIELLLSGPYTPSETLLGLLFVCFTLTAVNWLLLSATCVLGALGLLLAMHIDLAHFGSRLLLLLVFPLPLAYLSNLIGVILAIVFPRAAQIRTGGFNLFQLLAIAPSLVLLLIANFFPSLDPFSLAVCAMGVGLAGSVAAMSIIGRLYDPSSLLAS
jgi:ABC-type transport system involved in multi-copper enzyme maturation permease subunit